MRPRNQILGDLAKRSDKVGFNNLAPFYDLAILEVLLDMRDLLARSRRGSNSQSQE